MTSSRDPVSTISTQEFQLFWNNFGVALIARGKFRWWQKPDHNIREKCSKREAGSEQWTVGIKILMKRSISLVSIFPLVNVSSLKEPDLAFETMAVSLHVQNEERWNWSFMFCVFCRKDAEWSILFSARRAELVKRVAKLLHIVQF